MSIVSDRRLDDLLIEHRGDNFTITIRQAGQHRVSANGCGYDDSGDRQSSGSGDVVLSFHLLPDVIPQYIREGNQIDIFFASSVLPLAALRRNSPVRSTPFDAQAFTPVQSSSSSQANEAVLSAESNSFGPATNGGSRGNSLFTELPPLRSASNINFTTTAASVAVTADGTTVNPGGCQALCDIPEAAKKGDYAIVNANDPSDVEGATKFPNGGTVFFTRMNPFKWSYRINRKETDIAASVVESFISHIFTGDLGDIGALPQRVATSTASQSGQPTPTSSGGTSDCVGKDAEKLEELTKYAIDLEANTKAAASALDAKSKAFNKAKKSYNAFLEQTDTDTQGIDCSAVCQSANELLPQLRKVDLGDAEKTVTELKNAAAALEAQARAYKPVESGSDPTRCAAHFRILLAAATNLSADVKKVEESYQSLKKAIDENQGQFDALAKIINGVFGVIASGGNPFVSRQPLAAGEDGKMVEFTVKRKNLRAPNAQEVELAAKPTFQVGESRLSLSAGFGFSTINEIKIVRQSSLVPGENGSSALGTRFGFENKSKFRPSGVIMLNGVLRRLSLFGKNDSTLALSGGLVLSNRGSGGDNSGLATEFIAGPSLGILNNRIFLTFGFHAARVEELGGGFKIGDPVPNDLPDPLPLEKNWRNGLMFAITYRIRPR